MRYRNAVGGSDGVRYYVSMEAYTGARSLFVYDTRYAVWHREDGFDAVAFGWQDGLYALARDGGLWLLTAANADATAETTNVVTAGSAKNSATANGVEETVSSFAELRTSRRARRSARGAGKLELRMELVAGEPGDGANPVRLRRRVARRKDAGSVAQAQFPPARDPAPLRPLPAQARGPRHVAALFPRKIFFIPAAICIKKNRQAFLAGFLVTPHGFSG